MNPTPHIIESSLLLLGAFMLGCLIGYAIKRLSSRRTNPPVLHNANGHIAKGSGGTAPESDELRKIKGIGPKLEAVLNENGIYRYEQIAAWDARMIAEMNERLSFHGRIERERWVSQAQALLKSARH
jgi:predicted flap endonuclease-1-like 5' DNA nuclease